MATQVLNRIRASSCLPALFALVICLTDSASFAQATQVFVNHAAQGLNNGSSWQHAYIDFQSALSDPGVTGASVIQMFVAEGTYKPSIESVPGNVLTKTFSLPPVSQNLLIQGGFPTGGGVQDPDLHKTYLSGDLDGDDGNYASWWPTPPLSSTLTDNVFHVVTANVDDNVTLSGCTIRGGYARVLSPPQDAANSELGGGLFTLTGTPTLRNLVIEYCQSLGDQAPRVGCGGGLYSAGSSLDIRDCTFRHCVASINGGGLCKTEGDLLAVRCRFESCRAIVPGGRGGGLRVNLFGGEAHAVNCVFRDCIAEELGGGASIGSLDEPIGGEGCGGLLPGQGLATFSNCLFINNAANGPTPGSCTGHGRGGGGLRTAHPTEIRSCSFVKNSARFGAAISSWHLASLRIYNSVIWDNTHIPSACSTSELTELDRQVWVCIPTSCPCLLTITSSCVQGWGTDGP